MFHVRRIVNPGTLRSVDRRARGGSPASLRVLDGGRCASTPRGDDGDEQAQGQEEGHEQRQVSVTVGGTEGDQVDLYIVQSIGKDTVSRQITEQITRQIGRAPESVRCPADLRGDVGATLRCELVDAGQTYGVTVTTEGTSGRSGPLSMANRLRPLPTMKAPT